MPTPVEIGFEANGEQTVKRAWETVAKGCEDAIRSLAKMTPESQKADEAQKKLGQSAEKWLKQISTPMQDYLGDLEELQQLLAAGKLNQEQYALAVDLTKKKLQEQNVEIDELAAKGEKVRASLVGPQQAHNEKLRELDRLRKAGKLTEQEYAKAVANTKREYVESTQAATKYGNAGTDGTASVLGLTRQSVVAIGAMAAGYGLVTKVIGLAADANRQLTQSINDTSRTLREDVLKFQIQAGMTPEQVKGQLPAIEHALLKTPSANAAGGIQLQTQIKSSGMNDADADSGGLANTFLELKAATNQWGRDAGDEKTMVRSVNQYLKANGIAKPGENDVRQLGKQVSNLFEVSDLQFSHLGNLAKEASTFENAGMDTNTQLAYFAGLVDEMEPSEAATGLRNVVTRLSTTVNSPEKTAALKKLKLKPEQVAISKGGNKIGDVLKLIDERLSTVKPDERNALVNELLGEQGQATFNLLTNDVIPGKIQDFQVAQVKGTAFDRGVKSFNESDYAQQQRVAIKTDFARRKADQVRVGPSHQEVREIGNLAVAEAEARGDRGTAWAQGVGNKMFDVGEGVGLTPEETVQWQRFVMGQQQRTWGEFVGGKKTEPILRGYDRPIEPTTPLPANAQAGGNEVVPLLKQIADKKLEVKLTRQVNQPQKPRPSEANAAAGVR